MDLREVDYDTFYDTIGPMREVRSTIAPGKWPYTTDMVNYSGKLVGRIVGYLPENSGLAKYRYYLLAEEP